MEGDFQEGVPKGRIKLGYRKRAKRSKVLRDDKQEGGKEFLHKKA